LGIQPRVATAAGGLTPDEIVLEKIKDLTARLPTILDREEGLPILFKTDKNGLLSSLTTVLLQEMIRFNKLLRVMKRSLEDLDKAINGFIVMSAELDSMYVAFQNNQVPPNWSSVGYLCLKPLSTWYLDLIERIAFFESWIKEGQPRSFWISGFFFPQGFMTGVLQTHARTYQIAIDKLKFSFEILVQESAEEIEEEPEDGVYIYGLFMDGARWDRDTMTIADQHPSEMYDKMPVIHFKP
jgi:dynein heavy chain